MKNLKTEKEKLLREQKELDKVFAISNTAVFPKVQVYIGSQWMTVEDNFGPSRFQLIGSEITRTQK